MNISVYTICLSLTTKKVLLIVDCRCCHSWLDLDKWSQLTATLQHTSSSSWNSNRGLKHNITNSFTQVKPVIQTLVQNMETKKKKQKHIFSVNVCCERCHQWNNKINIARIGLCCWLKVSWLVIVMVVRCFDKSCYSTEIIKAVI